MEIPADVIEHMKELEHQLGRDFSRTWGLLPICPERDAIMLHILKAKTSLHEYIKEVENNG